MQREGRKPYTYSLLWIGACHDAQSDLFEALLSRESSEQLLWRVPAWTVGRENPLRPLVHQVYLNSIFGDLVGVRSVCAASNASSSSKAAAASTGGAQSAKSVVGGRAEGALVRPRVLESAVC